MPEFEPRRAEPGTEFTFTTSEEKTFLRSEVPDGATILAVDDDDPHRVRVRIDGVHKTFRADDEGVVRPKNEDQEATMRAFGLPVARKAEAEDKAQAASSRARKE